jgi:hypothetical protein
MRVLINLALILLLAWSGALVAGYLVALYENFSEPIPRIFGQLSFSGSVFWLPFLW